MKLTSPLLLTAITLVQSYAVAVAQIDSSSQKQVKGWFMFGVNVHGGIIGDRNFNTFDLARIKKMSLEPEVFLSLPPDTEKAFLNIHAEKIRRHPSFGGSVSFRPDRGGNDYVNEIRVGVSWYGGSGDNLFYTYTDTLADDRLRIRTFGYEGNVNQLCIEPVYIFKSSPFWRKFGTYSGVGLTAGYSARSEYKFHYTEQYIALDSASGNEDVQVIKDSTRSFKVKSSINFGAFVPIGIKYRITESFILRAEARLGFNILHSNTGTPFMNYQRGVMLIMTYRINKAKSKQVSPWTF